MATLVHPGVAAHPLEREQHEAFIAGKLASSLSALALLPLYITYHGLRAPWEAVAFAWLLLPLVAVLHVSRTGRIVEAHALCLLCIAGLVATLTVAGVGSGAALAWLILIPLEALVADRARLILAASLSALAGLLALIAFAPGVSRGASPGTQAMFVIPALLYAGALALGIHYRGALLRRREAFDIAQIRLVADTAGDLVLHCDPQGSVVFASAEAQSLFDLTSSELLGRGLFERIHVGDRPTFLKAVADANDSDERVVATLKLRRGQMPGGAPEIRFAFVELRLRRAQKSANAPTIAVIVRDITSLRLHEAALESARGEAERNNVWKDRFLANVSHELRTPLNAIIGFSEMLATENLTPADPAKQREYANIIRSSGEHLLSVVNTILDVSKIESGSFDLTLEPFAIAPLIDACADMIRLKAEKGHVRMVRDCPHAIPEIVADKRACKQILINLLSNAVKFTPPGGTVTVTARTEGKFLVLAVLDTGIGILARDLPRIGDPFFQVNGAYDRRYEGTGLGLSVVRGLVGLHGGSIAIDSAPGEGTTINIKLPLDGRQGLGKPAVIARIDTAQRHSLVKPPLSDPSQSPVKKSA